MNKYLTNVKKGWGEAVTGLAKVAEVAKDLAEETLSSNAKCLKDYQVHYQVASSGPGDVWRIYAATSKKPSETHMPRHAPPSP